MKLVSKLNSLHAESATPQLNPLFNCGSVAIILNFTAVQYANELKNRLSTTEMAAKLSKTAYNYLSAMIMGSYLTIKFRKASLLAMVVSCSIFNHRSGLLGFSVANRIQDSTTAHFLGIYLAKKTYYRLAELLPPSEIKRTYTYNYTNHFQTYADSKVFLGMISRAQTVDTRPLFFLRGLGMRLVCMCVGRKFFHWLNSL